jgi:hypothetical protein
MVICFFIGTSAWALKIPKSEIQVLGTQGWCCVAFEPDYGDPANTIDGDINNYWNGTKGLVTGDNNFLAYKFNAQYSISQIDFWGLPWHEPQYFMGELDIQVSQNSTDGSDGVWKTVDHIDGDYAPGRSLFSRFLNILSTQWVRLWMKYQDRGAHGGTPAFYLNEIDFHGELVSVPEPATILLLGSGLIGLAGFIRKFKK